MIPFHQPLHLGSELRHVMRAAASGRVAGGGPYTDKCQQHLAERYGFARCLLTTSGTAALEMAAMLTGVGPGDEVIVPSYTFVTTALAFVRQGASIVFADSGPDQPHLDPRQLEALITPRTRVIVPVHYAGIACDMRPILALARRHKLLVVTDAAQALDAAYCQPIDHADCDWQPRAWAQSGRYPLGGLGHLGCLSFHETKNAHCGEGGLLVVNDRRFHARAEIVWDKGTNRAAFRRGETSRYDWIDVGSSFQASDLNAAFLWGQLAHLDRVQNRRQQLWRRYREALAPLAGRGLVSLPVVPPYAAHNAHLFYLVCRTRAERDRLTAHLAAHGVQAAPHFLGLHAAPFCAHLRARVDLPNCDRFVDGLLRLPLYYDLREAQLARIARLVRDFFGNAPRKGRRPAGAAGAGLPGRKK
jgi:dTDP-4-amino-4,6-dideoxygalactose transaminase